MRVTEVTRRNILDGLRMQEVEWWGRLDEREFLSRIWDLETLPSYDDRHQDASGDIWQHRIINPSDWPDDWVYSDSRFNLVRCLDEIFTSFLCELIHPLVRTDAHEIERLLEFFNGNLQADDVLIVETSRISGRPVYGVEIGSRGKPRAADRSTMSREIEVFISYAREDKGHADKVFQRLRIVGAEPWLDTYSILPGQNWRHAIRKAIEDSRVFLALMSSASIDKQGYVQRELRQALDILGEFPPESIYLIPVRLDECRPKHERLADLQWVDLFPEFEAGFSRILGALMAAGIDCSVQRSPSVIDEVGHLSELESLVLTEMRGKPDVNWTPGTIRASLQRKRSVSAPSNSEIESAAARLVAEGYLTSEPSGRLVVTEKGVVESGKNMPEYYQDPAIIIDTSTYSSSRGSIFTQPYDELIKAWELIELASAKLPEMIDGESYGKRWAFRDTFSGRVLLELAPRWRDRRGFEEEALNIADAGITPGMKLEVVPLVD